MVVEAVLVLSVTLVACRAADTVGWLTGWVVSLALLTEEAAACCVVAEVVGLLLELADCVLVLVAGETVDLVPEIRL